MCLSTGRGLVSQYALQVVSKHALQQVSRSEGGAIPTCIAGGIPACLATGLGVGVCSRRGLLPGGCLLRGCLHQGGMLPEGGVPASGGGFETQRRLHQKSKTGVSVSPQKRLQKFLKSQNPVLFLHCVQCGTRRLLITIHIHNVWKPVKWPFLSRDDVRIKKY